MIDYCYITKFKYITQAELNFIDEVSKFKKIEVYILNTNQIYNLYYKLLITLVFKIERKMQEIFTISRNYMVDGLVKIDSPTKYINKDFLNINKWVYLDNTGLVFSDQKFIAERKNKVWCLLNKIGESQEYNDQNLLLITNIKSNDTKIIFRGKYEKDGLDLNNKIISIRRVLYHAVNIAKSN